MNDDYGKQIGRALKAVRQMHQDVSKLLNPDFPDGTGLHV